MEQEYMLIGARAGRYCYCFLKILRLQYNSLLAIFASHFHFHWKKYKNPDVTFVGVCTEHLGEINVGQGISTAPQYFIYNGFPKRSHRWIYLQTSSVNLSSTWSMCIQLSFSLIKKWRRRRRSHKCTGGNAMLPNRPSTVLVLCVTATRSYISGEVRCTSSYATGYTATAYLQRKFNTEV